MDSEIPGSAPETTPQIEPASAIPPAPVPPAAPPSTLRRVFMGPDGLRFGWGAAIYATILIGVVVGLQEIGKLIQELVKQSAQKPSAAAAAASQGLTPLNAIVGEGIFLAFIALLTLFMALIEHRNPLIYNLRGPGSISRFLSGLAAGFVALSALVGGLALGGWIHFGPVALHGGQIAQYAAVWALGFLIVGLTEEGATRCYVQYTLARGINFWWALGIVGVMCAILIPQYKNQSAWGVWIFAATGLVVVLLLRNSEKSSFWRAAWVTSTFFGFAHVSNNGENWIGIFAAAGIGFVFCASIYYTGSAWWAIGCHAAWDWAETFFYGTADSGNAAHGHFLTTSPAGNPLWSGGADGPEGSLLVIPAIVLILALVWVQYGRKKAVAQPAA